jgi:xanthine/CO dehydrogenase XdhC/CoxF family maturation factor
MAVLKELASKKISYIGVLGPKKKLARMLAELGEVGLYKEPGTSNIYGPVGLDLGAETPEEIALSIIAEIKAVLSNKTAGFLRDISGNIHAQSTEVANLP